MKRREFIRNASLVTAGTFFLEGTFFKQLYGFPQIQALAKASKNDRILIILQLHGGNDGLNQTIPINQYAEYYNLRPNIAISDTGSRRYIKLDNLLPDDQQLGLHPDMLSLKQLYDMGKVNIVQNVGYENMNGSHFKGRDIWFGGVGANDRITSGWIGRYLELEFEGAGGVNPKFPDDFPNNDMPDPLGLEFSGGDVSLGFHTEDTIPTAISIPSPSTFFGLVSTLPGYDEEILKQIDDRGFPPASLNGSLYANELNWILGIEDSTYDYAKRLKECYDRGGNTQVNYPERYPLAAPNGFLNNPLATPFKIIARLISGGCMTKVYLVRIGGFDTHINQVERYDNSLGAHAALTYHVFATMKAFQEDLRLRGIEGRVVTVTMSEFGRRAKSNASYGSDHGTVAPMFVFGNKINPGVIGKNTDLRKAQISGNLSDAVGDFIDYRTVFSTILQDWFDVEPSKIPIIFPNFNPSLTIPLFNKSLTPLDNFLNERYRLEDVYPNPVKTEATFGFYINTASHVRIKLQDLKGNLIAILMNDFKPEGKHTFSVNLSFLRAGTYVYTLETNQIRTSKKLVKV
ncbi:MAG: DUF1501 domain-containing protein [Raineya sp.]|nr:DUF1501 domain-containing protein [Raineya sp.]